MRRMVIRFQNIQVQALIRLWCSREKRTLRNVPFG